MTKPLCRCFSAGVGVLLLLAQPLFAERPNVLLLLVDDLKPSMGCYGDPLAKTPNLDALAERGMRFDLAYCNQAVCAPSRFTLMLGSHSTSTGLYSLGSRLRSVLPDAVTMPQHFAKHGYRTESLGKIFHIGHGNQGDPDSFSVPHFKEKVIEYADPASKPDGKLTREEAMFQNVPAPPGGMNMLPRGAAFEAPDVDDEAYADGRVAAETIRRLQAATERDDPFFIAAGFARPHLPFSAPKKYWDWFDPADFELTEFPDLPTNAPGVAGKRGGEIRNYFPVPDKNDPAQITDKIARELIHGYYASTSYVDAQIGKVMDELDRLGLADNTIVVLWGDHGFHLGDLGIWTKHTNYEQANRIPILISAPGVTKPGSFTNQPAESVDIFPTVAELAGLPSPDGPQPIDGVSLVPVLKDPAARVRYHAFHAYPKGKLGRAIRTERYRLVEWKEPGADPKSAEIELYDYQDGNVETENVAVKMPEVVQELRAKLAAYPEAKPRARRKAAPKPAESASGESPNIAGKELTIVAEVKVKTGVPHGVVLAQGGRENGFALHFDQGKPIFDVRIKGRVHRLEYGAQEGYVKLEAGLQNDRFYLKGGDDQDFHWMVEHSKDGDEPTPTLIPAQPKDPLSVGMDVLSAAGDYQAPNPFNGMILYTNVQAGGKPPKVSNITAKGKLEAGFQTHDRALFVLNGWIRDPYIAVGPDGVYYLTGTTPNPDDPRETTDPYNSGLGVASLVGWQAQVWRSEDLLEWESLGTPFTLKDGIWATENPEAFAEVEPRQWRLWAPELHWIEEHDRWALVHTSPSPVKGANLSLSAGRDVAGPWENPFGPELERRHDPSMFRDDDGTRWLVWGATTIAPLKADLSGFSDKPTKIGPSGQSATMGHEGCLIMKIEGKYVLFGTGWSTGLMRRGSYNLYYATADKITGPYSERKFAGRFLGHGTPFQDGEGRWWCTAFYNANTPPVSREGIQSRDLSSTAQTINQRGTTLVPLDVRMVDGELLIRAKDPDYANPGPDEAEKF